MDELPNTERERKLPIWAQRLLNDYRDRNTELTAELDRVRTAHSVLLNRNWFTIPGPSFESEGDFRYLWFLDRENPRPVCALGDGDVLLVGRRIVEEKGKGNV